MTKHERNGDIILLVLDTIVTVLKNSKKIQKLFKKKTAPLNKP